MFKHIFLSFTLLFSALTRAEYLRNIHNEFTEWHKKFDIVFKGAHEYEKMLARWIENDLFIIETNARNLSYSLGHNRFSGMNIGEFREYIRQFPFLESKEVPPLLFKTPTNPGYKLPASVNWVEVGAVTPVKDQGQCGSCWSFSTTGAVEGAYYNVHGKLQSFSEQQLVDCDNLRHGGRDHGCNGGLMDNAFAWIGKNGGLCLETAYPYVSGETTSSGDCKETCDPVADSMVVTFVDVEPNSDSAMMAAIAKQPVSIAIEADQREFQLYKSGVFTGECGAKLDHGVLVVGYGNAGSDGDYYLVKNSWGLSWGDGGYIYLGRGTDPKTGEPYNKGAGQCGILAQASFPVL